MQVICYTARYYANQVLKKERKKKIAVKYPSTIWLRKELFYSTVRDCRHESFIPINTYMVHRIRAESSQPETTIGQRNLTSRAGILSHL